MNAKILIIFVSFLLLNANNKLFAQFRLNYKNIYSTTEFKVISLKFKFEPKTCGNIMKNFLLNDKDKYKFTLTNNFLWLIPPLAWNIAWSANNPAQLGYFNGEAPHSILVAENIFRVSSMMYPLLLPIEPKNKYFKAGLITYLLGSALYYASWTYLMYNPNSQLSQTVMMRFAPAYTPIIWLTGISLLANSKIHFSLSLIFISLHVAEYICRY